MKIMPVVALATLLLMAPLFAQENTKSSVAIAIIAEPHLVLSRPKDSTVECPTISQVVNNFSDNIARAFLDSGDYVLIERDQQERLNQEIRLRASKGEALEDVVKDVCAKYRVDYYFNISELTIDGEYTSFFFDEKTRGEGTARASWIHVASGATRKKVEAHAEFKRDGKPGPWFDEMGQKLARGLSDQILPPRYILLVKIDQLKQLIYVDRGLDYGLHKGLKLYIREPRDEMGLPGEKICDAIVTDRITNDAAICQLSGDKKKLVDVMAKLERFLADNTPPECTAD
ncbi:MAG: hypothetical protein ABFE08_18375 [Armatimonadia bacterium]